MEELTEERLVPVAGTESPVRLLEHKLNLDAARIVEHGSLGDQGIDVIGTLARPGPPAVRLAVQAKRVAGGVGPSVVTKLRRSIPPGAYGVIITTGHFTRAAIAEADRCPGWTLLPSTTGLRPSRAKA